jgi:hypothetical protein
MRSTTRLIVVAVFAALAIAISAGAASAAVSSFTVNPRGTLSAGGTQVNVGGTISCDAFDSVFIFTFAAEVVGRVSTGASHSQFTICTGEVQQWSATLSCPVCLPFLPGRADLEAVASDFTDFFSAPAIINEPIVLTPK